MDNIPTTGDGPPQDNSPPSESEPSTTTPTKLKTCKRCSKEKPLTEFHKNKAIKDGHASICKECKAEKNKEYNMWKAAKYKKPERPAAPVSTSPVLPEDEFIRVRILALCDAIKSNIHQTIIPDQAFAWADELPRRLGWWFLNPGDIVNSCEKCQGLKKGEKIVLLNQIRIIKPRPELLQAMTDDLAYGEAEVILEGFPNMTPFEFVEMFCDHNKCLPDTTINRIKFEYI